MFSILDMISHPPTIHVVDVGAMFCGEGTEPYHVLLKDGLAKVVGFEPVQAECDKLNQVHKGEHLFLPYFIGDGGTHTFHLCNHTMTSSLIEPNRPLVDKFQNLENLMRVERRSKAHTRRLDDIEEVAGTDFLKVDVQGGELLVFKGARKVLAETVIVQTEVEFVPLYRDQPLFADIDQELRSNGFLLHKLGSICGRTFKPLTYNNDPDAMMSQMLWSDAVYVKNFMELDRLPAEKLLKLAIVLHEVYRSLDLCLVALRAYDAQAASTLSETYLAKLPRSAKLSRWVKLPRLPKLSRRTR